jgi:hypothetical protein
MQFRRIVPVALGLAAFVLPPAATAQQLNPAVNVSSVVRGGVVVVSYDLSGTANAVFEVQLEASSDGGKTYAVRPKSVTGDVGPAVRSGAGKQITWEAARDVENLQVDRFRYRVTATGPQGAAAGNPRTASQPPAQSSPSVKSGSGRKWGGIALLGAGGALMVMSNTTMKKDDYLLNKPVLWAGVGMAAGGVTLLALSGKNSDSGTRVVLGPTGIAIQHRLQLVH